MNDALIGRTLAGKFVIESLIGSGSMGAVYKARQIALDKVVAVKVMHSTNAADQNFIARFQREAKAASRLDHPNSTRVIDFGSEPDGLLYLVMEYLNGTPLSALLERRGALLPEETVSVMVQILAALGVAHEMGVIHRDMKPDNVVLLEGRDDEGNAKLVVKVCDFGVATLLSENPSPRQPLASAPGPKLTSHGLIVGTPHYMSPEQARGDAIDARSDLYSAGVMLYELLTGCVPFDGATTVDVIIKQVTEEPEPPSVINPGCDPRLASICMKAIRKRKEDRYQSAREMRSALRSATGWNEDPTRPTFLLDLSASSSPSLPLALGGKVPPNSPTLPAPPSTSPLASKESPSAQLSPSPHSSQPSWSESAPGGSDAMMAHAQASAGAPLAQRPLGFWLLATASIAVIGLGLVSLSHLRQQRTTRSPTSGSPLASAPELPEPPPLSQPAVEPSKAPPAPLALPPGSVEASGPSARAPGPRLAPLAPARPAPRGPSEALAEATAAPPPLPSPASAAATLSPVPPQPAPPPVAPEVSPPAPPAAPPFDAGRARVDWSVSSVSGGTNQGNVRRALSPVSGGWSGCFQGALRAAGRAVSGAGVLHLRTDDTGHVISASVSGFDALPSVGPCIAARSYVTIPEVDTGDVSASVSLVFRAE